MNESITPPSRTTEVYFLLPSADGQQVLVLSVDDGWRLPAHRFDFLLWPADIQHLHEPLSTLLDSDTSILRFIDYSVDSSSEHSHGWIVYVLEPAQSDWSPPARS